MGWSAAAAGLGTLSATSGSRKLLLRNAIKVALRSPSTTPFVAPLPVPPPPQTVAPFVPSPEAVEHLSRIGAGSLNTRFYNIVQEPALVSLHPELPDTPVWRYRDVHAPANSPYVAGPTFAVRQGDPQVIKHMNRLPSNHTGFGVPHTTAHFHGGHVDPFFDGFPEDIPEMPRVVSKPGQDFDYVYAMQDPGFLEGNPDPTERNAMQWYHDHLLDFTGPNVYRGLSGAYIVYDDLDTGSEHTGLRLPAPLGVHDIPLVLQDRRIAGDGSLVYLPEDFDGFLGDKYMVNGAINPYLTVSRRKYRFRVLNGSNARHYLLSVTDANSRRKRFDIIATEGGLLSRPIRNQRKFLVGNAEQIEFVIDFADYPPGTELYLSNFLEQDNGRGPKGDFERPRQVDRGDETRIMKFIVQGGAVADPSQVPNTLRPFEPISQAEIDAADVVETEFERKGGAWAINDEFVDLHQPMINVTRNRPVIWRIKNGGGGWWHPIHIHIENMRILSRNGQRPGPLERDGIATQNTVNLSGGDEVEAFFRFRDFTGAAVFHCHNIEHEDHFMMARFDINPS